jgi:SagB-type dehydrogenase family enzyme
VQLDDSPSVTETLRVDEAVSIDRGEQSDRAWLRIRGRALDVNAAVADELSTAIEAWSPPAEVESRILEASGVSALAEWHGAIAWLEYWGAVGRCLALDGDDLLRVWPRAVEPDMGPRPIQGSYALSPLVMVRALQGNMVLEFPGGSWAEIVDPVLWQALFSLRHPLPVNQLGDECALPFDAARAVISVLARSHLIVSGDDAQPAATLPGGWDPWGAAYHLRSRGALRIGLMAPLGSASLAKPATHESRTHDRIALPPPDDQRIPGSRVTLLAALEGRRSVRAFSRERVPTELLGSFLYHSFRGSGPHRPFPSGGGLYPLDAYVVDQGDDGEERLLKYLLIEHALAPLPAPSPLLEQVLWSSAHLAHSSTKPPVLILLAANFDAVNRKYGPVAYSLVLKEVGAVMQSMYLVAGALGLGGCAIGSGDSTAMSRVLGTSTLDYATVGEFMLGLPLSEDQG